MASPRTTVPAEFQQNANRALYLVIGILCLVLVVALSGQIFENVDANEILVVQAPMTGKLSVYTTPGIKWQGFGKVTSYLKREQFSFSVKSDQGDKTDQSIKVRFNDGGHAQLSGVINWEMPTDEKSVIAIHTKYGSQTAVENQMVRPVIEKAVYMTGPLMSSKESANEKRAFLISYIEDQIANGVYQTYNEDVKQPDPITGEQKTVTVVRLKEQNGTLLRQDESPLKTFGIRTFGLSLNAVNYDQQVEAQIQQQQQAIMQVQTAIANAKKAEQDAITVQKQGEAEAAKAKWEQEVIKARAVTEADMKVEVAKRENEAAEQYRQAMIKKGQGEGEYRKLVMQGDGALDKKLAAYVDVQKAYAAALASGHISLVPQIQTGGGQGNNGLNMIDLLGIKAARDLAVDVQAQGAGNTKK